MLTDAYGTGIDLGLWALGLTLGAGTVLAPPVALAWWAWDRYSPFFLPGRSTRQPTDRLRDTRQRH